ncbi:hypothetical protein B0A52_01015 [Exophiala mesophila]|uniref:Beta-xylosidase C-terminal Concanavalin A-like domain-containing protein n=1 Tax=Exophiala mesophila TaxID=212818 RepID=A0A438NG86_EXOME|nr:hypothetical protein B0A52_01015 [Exophiala mesophila]
MPQTTVNPIIPGFAPDPSVVLIDDIFFLVNSTFHMFPGLPIYASKDLISWKQIGNAINRRAQLSLRLSDTSLVPLEDLGEVMLATGGLYAPTIRQHNGIVYVVCTNVIHNEGSTKDVTENFIVSTHDIWSDEWSDPVYFEFQGIDPSLFFDQDGKAYIHGSAAPGPMTKIHLFEIDLATGKKLSEEKKIWDGTGGIYPEGPHIYKRDDWYYLLISEGGTHGDHMITAARSTDIWGPYEEYERNPILTAKGTDEYIQYTGHSDVFQDQKGEWWGVCLGVRKDQGKRFIMGRETFLTHGSWPVGQWPSLDRVKSDPTTLSRTPSPQHITSKSNVDYLYIRDVDLSLYVYDDSKGTIKLTTTNVDLSHPTDSPTFVGKRQRQLDGASSVSLGLEAQTLGYQAGLAVYKDEHRYIRIFYDSSKKAVMAEKKNKAKELHQVIRSELLDPVGVIEFQIAYAETEYRLSYRGTGAWNQVMHLDTLEMTDPDFVGPVVGIFAVGSSGSVEVEFSALKID